MNNAVSTLPADVAPPPSGPTLGDLARTAPRELSDRATGALIAELTRHPGPKQVLVAGDDPVVVERVLDHLGPKDELVIWVSDAVAAVPVRARVAARSRFVAERVAIWDSRPPIHAQPFADVAIVTDIGAHDAAARVATIRPYLRPEGILSLATPVRPRDVLTGFFRSGPSAPAVSGMVVRRDLVLRNTPPIWVTQLRFDTADPALAERLAPITRPSSVELYEGMRIDSNGLVAAGICGGLALLTKAVRPRSAAWLLPALAALPVAAFFRDPERVIADDPRAIVAASDGVVLSVEQVTDNRFDAVNTEWLRIAVFLSVLDVHVNRAPVAGRVVDIITADGGYAMAQQPAAEDNVAQYTVLETSHGRVVTAQRTGLIARRIVNRSKIGALLAKGERFGLIRFGSRTDVYLPIGSAEGAAGADAAAGPGVEVIVEQGDRVRGGATILAHWRT